MRTQRGRCTAAADNANYAKLACWLAAWLHPGKIKTSLRDNFNVYALFKTHCFCFYFIWTKPIKGIRLQRYERKAVPTLRVKLYYMYELWGAGTRECFSQFNWLLDCQLVFVFFRCNMVYCWYINTIIRITVFCAEQSWQKSKKRCLQLSWKWPDKLRYLIIYFVKALL